MPARRKSTTHLEASGYFRKHPERRRVEPPSNGPVGEAPDYFHPAMVALWDELKAQAEPGVLRKSDRSHLELTTWLLYRSRYAPEHPPRWLSALSDLLQSRGMSEKAAAKVTDSIFQGIRARPGEGKLLGQCLEAMYMTPLARAGR